MNFHQTDNDKGRSIPRSSRESLVFELVFAFGWNFQLPIRNIRSLLESGWKVDQSIYCSIQVATYTIYVYFARRILQRASIGVQMHSNSIAISVNDDS